MLAGQQQLYFSILQLKAPVVSGKGADVPLSKFFPYIGVCLWLLSFCSPARAQSSAPQFEAGLHFTSLRLRTIGEGAAGLGGRFTYNRFEHLAFEAEISHFPENPSGNFGETEALFGVKVGTRFDRFGVFAKVRPGFIHFGGGDAAERLSDRTHFACDLGGVLEYYPSSRWLIRTDFGDTIIAFTGTRFLSPIGTPAGPNVVRLGTTHNFQGSIGFAIRF